MKPRPDPDVPAAARLFADPSRAQILEALLDAPCTPGQLARIAGVTAPTITSHLGRLDEAGLITRRGRHVELAGEEVPRLIADALEALARLAPLAATLAPGAPRIAAELRAARSCYDHLAGRLGVAITEALIARGVLDADLSLTTSGRTWAAEQGLALATARNRPLTRACIDWSERRPHVAGTFGATLLDWLRDEGWVVPIRNSRALRVSDRGARALRERLGIGTD